MTFAIACLVQVQAAGIAKSDTKVKATATASKVGADGKQTVSIVLAIEKPFYIYTNPVGADLFEDNRTKVEFKAKEKLTASVNYPPGKLKTEVLSKDTTIKYYTYADRVVLEAQVRRTLGDNSPLEITIDVNACHPGTGKDDGYCLAPGKVLLTVP